MGSLNAGLCMRNLPNFTWTALVTELSLPAIFAKNCLVNTVRVSEFADILFEYCIRLAWKL